MASPSNQESPHGQNDRDKVTVKEDGFTLLAISESPIADVFFIHGLQGHPRNT